MPQVTGQAYVFAKGILQDGGFAWHVLGPVQGYAGNTVVDQAPAAGSVVLDTGAPTITLTLARNPAYAEQGTPENNAPYDGTTVLLPGNSPAARALPNGRAAPPCGACGLAAVAEGSLEAHVRLAVQAAMVTIVVDIDRDGSQLMDVVLGAFALLPGLALGSFLNVVAARLPERRSLVRPRSACCACATPIAWYDNVPLLGYVALRGRCRTCKTRISPIYPAVELATAATARRLPARLRALAARGGGRRLLRRARRHHRHRPHASDRPEPGRPSGGGDRARADDRRRAEARSGRSRASAPQPFLLVAALAVSAVGWGWGTSSSRC